VTLVLLVSQPVQRPPRWRTGCGTKTWYEIRKRKPTRPPPRRSSQPYQTRPGTCLHLRWLPLLRQAELGTRQLAKAIVVSHARTVGISRCPTL
jgi:hypothetical protein